ncbi:MAG: ArsB/NhaD family transporter [Candidatus Margulisiibacteriota bacterium]
MDVFLAIFIFVVTYILIVSEHFHQTLLVLLGGVLMVGLGIIDQTEAIKAVDFNTIGLLVGMMIVVEIVKETGIFQYLAIQAAKLAKGHPMLILIYISLITAVASAMLDNVTTILIVLPLILVVTDTLEISPIPFLISQIIISNIGGTATLIGDPPNILIGSATGLGFNDFLVNMAPVSIVIALVSIVILCVIYRKDLKTTPEIQEKIMQFNPSKLLQSYSIIKRSLFVLLLIFIGFMTHKQLNLEAATIALGGASLLLVLTELDPKKALRDVEWSTIYFITGMFVLVAGIEKVGVISFLANQLIDLSQGSLSFLTFLVIWLGGLCSAFLDNIPFIVTMIPMIKQVGTATTMNIEPLWWALALGGCLGGNGTLFGAAANVAAVGLYRNAGKKFSWMDFFRVGFPLTLVSLTIATIYVFIFIL